MNFISAIILGIIEGLTEYLPVSSTGHLILSREFLGLGGVESAKAFDVTIQIGAILAVLVYYRKLFADVFRELLQAQKNSIHFVFTLMIAFMPAAIIGLLFYGWIKQNLFSYQFVIWALIIGGIVMIVVERSINRRQRIAESPKATELSYKTALGIGLFQCLSLMPGTSRSMSTLLGGRLLGLSTVSAAEFSFFLALPTLSAASVYEFFKYKDVVLASSELGLMLLTGVVVSFFVALCVIHFFISYLKNNNLEIFGWYRIVLGVLLLFIL